MNKTFICAVIILFSLAYSEPIEKNWMGAYGTPNNDWACRMSLPGQQGSSAGYLICGYSQIKTHTGNRYNALLLQIDDHGRYLWSYTYPSPALPDFKPFYSAKAKSITTTTDSSYVVTGWINKGPGPAIFLLKIDAKSNALKIEFERILGGFDGWDVKEYKDQATGKKGYCVAGVAKKEGSLKLFVVKTDTDGIINENSGWAKTYSEFQNDWCGQSIFPTSDGEFIITGGTGDDPYPDRRRDSDAFIHKIDRHGNSVWKEPKILFRDKLTHAAGYHILQADKEIVCN